MRSDEASIAPTSQVVVYVALCTIAAYVLLTQCLYCWRNWRQGSASNDSRELHESILIAAASMAIFLYDILPIRGNWQQPSGYLTYPMGIIYTIASILIYSSLWLRQRWIYTNHSITHLTNKVSRAISKYFVVFIVMYGVCVTLCNFLLVHVGICTDKCRHDLSLASMIVGPFCCQITILCLIIFPLAKHNRTNSVADATCLALMKRLLIFTTICLTSDIASAGFYSNKWLHPTTKYLAPQINFGVNVMSVILTSANWKSRLIPCHNSSNFTKAAKGKAAAITIRLDTAVNSPITEDETYMSGRDV